MNPLCEPDKNHICVKCRIPLGKNNRICQKKQSDFPLPNRPTAVNRVSVVRPTERGEGPCDRCDEKDVNGLCEPARNVIRERTSCQCQPAEYRIRNFMGMVNSEITKCPK